MLIGKFTVVLGYHIIKHFKKKRVKMKHLVFRLPFLLLFATVTSVPLHPPEGRGNLITHKPSLTARRLRSTGSRRKRTNPSRGL